MPVLSSTRRRSSDLDAQLLAFSEEFRRVDLIYGAYGRRCGLSFSVYLIFDYICENDGTSQREICAYTLLPRQTVNNVINALISQGLLRLEGSRHDKRVKRIHLTDAGSATANRWSPPCARRNCRPWQPSNPTNAVR